MDPAVAAMASTDRSPYEVDITELILHFNTSTERQSILTGLLDFRHALHKIGLVRGFQWLDGSFLEHVEVTEALSEADPRAIETIRKFLETMEKSEVICALEFKGDVFRFADVEQVRRSVGRLAQDNLHEEDTCFPGMFQGVLPHRRTFEFQVSKTGKVISGKVGKEVTDAAAINRILYKSVKINVHSRSVGEGLPRYILTGYGESTISDE